MAKITIFDEQQNFLKEITATPNEKMALIIENQGIDILHLCGGKAKCTTCRIEYIEGNPNKHTTSEAEKIQQIIEAKGNQDKEMQNSNVRLSCQCLTSDSDVKIKVLRRVSTSNRQNSGNSLTLDIIPDPEWKEGHFNR